MLRFSNDCDGTGELATPGTSLAVTEDIHHRERTAHHQHQEPVAQRYMLGLRNAGIHRERDTQAEGPHVRPLRDVRGK